jgi:hypothetical protein
VFVYSSHGNWAFSPLLWSFPPTTTFTSFPAPGCWAFAATLAFSGGLFIYSSVRDSPPHLISTQGAPPSLLCVFFFCYFLLFSFSLFSEWGSFCPWGYADLAQDCLWEYHELLSSPCGLRLGTGICWRCGIPSGFSF